MNDAGVKAIRDQLLAALEHRFGPEGVRVVAEPYGDGLNILGYQLVTRDGGCSVARTSISSRRVAHQQRESGDKWVQYLAKVEYLYLFMVVRRRSALSPPLEPYDL
jgi:hypothetical protein